METVAVYAHVNIWTLNEAGTGSDPSAARAIGAALSQQPGFRSYTAVRSGEWQVIAVTVFESQVQLETAMEAVAPLVRAHVKPLASGKPSRHGGAVLHHVAA